MDALMTNMRHVWLTPLFYTSWAFLIMLSFLLNREVALEFSSA